jgi:hypothetical protein
MIVVVGIIIMVLVVIVGTVSAVGKPIGPLIERSLVRNPDWTATMFSAPLPSRGTLV